MTNTHEARLAEIHSALAEANVPRSEGVGAPLFPDAHRVRLLYQDRDEARAQVERMREALQLGNRLAAATFGLVGAVEEPFYGKPFTTTPTFIACVNEAEAAAAAFRAADPDPEGRKESYCANCGKPIHLDRKAWVHAEGNVTCEPSLPMEDTPEWFAKHAAVPDPEEDAT
jgi:hypothetical protein